MAPLHDGSDGSRHRGAGLGLGPWWPAGETEAPFPPPMRLRADPGHSGKTGCLALNVVGVGPLVVIGLEHSGKN